MFFYNAQKYVLCGEFALEEVRDLSKDRLPGGRAGGGTCS